MPLQPKITPLILLTAALALASCGSRKEKPCTEEKNIPFAKRDTLTLSPRARGFLNYIKNNYAQMEFGTWQGREVITLITAHSVETYFTRQFDSLGSINKIKLEKEDFCFATKNGYGIYNTRKGKMYLLQSIFESPVKITDSISTTLNLDLKKNYIMDQRAVLYIDTDSVKSFLINYGINQQKNINYLDKNIFLIPNNGQFLTIGEYPRGYVKKYRQVRDAYYATDSSANIYYTLAYSDSLYKMNLAGRYLNAVPVAQCSYFNDYEESDKTNLAYKRIDTNRYTLYGDTACLSSLSKNFHIRHLPQQYLDSCSIDFYNLLILNKKGDKIQSRQIRTEEANLIAQSLRP